MSDLAEIDSPSASSLAPFDICGLVPVIIIACCHGVPSLEL